MKKSKKNPATDIRDSAEDKRKLRGDEGELNLPDQDDIPGKKGLSPGASSDVTASSSGEEGEDVLDDENIISDNRANVSSEERKLLDDAFDPVSTDDEPIDEIALDSRDNDGELLNEKGIDGNLFGADLDTNLEEEEDEE